jgi:hypothetical protein
MYGGISKLENAWIEYFESRGEWEYYLATRVSGVRNFKNLKKCIACEKNK